MDPSRGDSRYNLNYSMSSIGLSLADQAAADMYGNPATVAALGGRPPSAGLLQSMGGGAGGQGVGISSRSSLMSNTGPQCQSLNNNSGSHGASQQQQQQQRGIKRSGSDCYDDSHHRVASASGGSGISTLQGLENCGGGGGNVSHSSQQPQPSSSGGVADVVEDNYNSLQSKKSPPANGKKTKGRVKIKMEYIDNKLRRYTTFSKRKTGIMKKAYELSTLTGTQVMLLVASETGHVYTFATRKLQPMITSEAGKQLIQTCLNSPDPPSIGGGDQRMSATGFEETELSYNIADEDSKETRSPISSINDSDESSDNDGIGNNGNEDASIKNKTIGDGHWQSRIHTTDKELHEQEDQPGKSNAQEASCQKKIIRTEINPPNPTNSSTVAYQSSVFPNATQDVLLKLIEEGHLQVHTEEDGSGHQYVAIPLPSSTADLIHLGESSSKQPIQNDGKKYLPKQTPPVIKIKEELE